MDNTHRAKTVQKPCIHGLQNKKAMKSFDFTAFSGAMEGTRTPGLLIRRNRMAHFVHFIIQRQIVVLIELPLFYRCYSIAFFALLARLCTCYPSLRCAENVQKCAEPKSARQNRLFRTVQQTEFRPYSACKIIQFYPDNNLTRDIGSMAGFRTSEQTPFDIEMRFTMNKLLSCRYNMDTNRVEARFEDGTTVAIDCLAIEDEYGNTPAQRAELDWLLYNKPLEYAQMVLRGEMERYLSLGCDHGRLDD